MMKNYFNCLKAAALFLLFAVISTGFSCKKSQDTSVSNGPLVVTTGKITGITSSAAVSSISASSIDDSFIADGVCWDTNPMPTVMINTKVVNFSRDKNFTVDITGLSGNITYYVRAFVTTKNGVVYGDQLSFTTAQASIAIGNSYGGGIIFYIDNTKQHGLAAAPSDQTESIAWDNGNYVNITTNFVTDTAVGTGQTNTDIIIAGLGTSPTTAYAAYLCKSLSINGFSDWFLPSKGELALMQKNLYAAKSGNFTAIGYWSSSTDATPDFLVWTENMSGNTQALNNISNTEGVRAVRAF